MSLERKVGKLGPQEASEHAKEFKFYFKTGGGWKIWEWFSSLGPMPKGSRNF